MQNTASGATGCWHCGHSIPVGAGAGLDMETEGDEEGGGNSAGAAAGGGGGAIIGIGYAGHDGIVAWTWCNPWDRRAGGRGEKGRERTEAPEGDPGGGERPPSGARWGWGA